MVEAKDLSIGDRLITQNKIIVTITNIEDEYGRFPVYNLNVDKNHNYYVSNMGILVHNCGREAIEGAGSLVKRFVGNEIGAIGSDVSRAGVRGGAPLIEWSRALGLNLGVKQQDLRGPKAMNLEIQNTNLLEIHQLQLEGNILPMH
ncbi:MAG: hypothetical protein HQK53_13285 [Oligoflexia bacterium]|nr:hypothetical protein [Oligoflexia bacterium]